MASNPIKWHGGKSYLAPWIISLMPPRCKNPNAPAADDPGWLHYVEPYFGGGAVLFANDPKGIGEVVNDICGDLTNFWSVLRTWTQFVQLKQMCEATPCAKSVFDEARERLNQERYSAASPGYSDDCIQRAWAFFVVNRQSRQALGKDFATLARSRTRRGMNELPSAWLSAIDGLPEFHRRLQPVVILNDDALKVIRQQDGPRTLFYFDPPYLIETRHGNGGEYEHEMNSLDHGKLLAVLSEIRGRFLLSGYPSALYQRYAMDGRWTRHEKQAPNQASGKKKKETKTECVWTNF